MTFDAELVLLGLGAVAVGARLLRWAIEHGRREKRLQTRFRPFREQSHTWHIVAPRPYDWQDDDER